MINNFYFFIFPQADRLKMAKLSIDYMVASQFISSLSKSLQALCHGCMDFDTGVEIVGYVNVNIDNCNKIDYILNERVIRKNGDSTAFVSNSFMAKNMQNQMKEKSCSPVPDLQVMGDFSSQVDPVHLVVSSPHVYLHNSHKKRRLNRKNQKTSTAQNTFSCQPQNHRNRNDSTQSKCVYLGPSETELIKSKLFVSTENNKINVSENIKRELNENEVNDFGISSSVNNEVSKDITESLAVSGLIRNSHSLDVDLEKHDKDQTDAASKNSVSLKPLCEKFISQANKHCVDGSSGEARYDRFVSQLTFHPESNIVDRSIQQNDSIDPEKLCATRIEEASLYTQTSDGNQIDTSETSGFHCIEIVDDDSDESLKNMFISNSKYCLIHYLL